MELVTRSGTARVYLATSDSRFARGFERALDSEEFVELVGTSRTARDMLQSVRELGPDILLLDWDLPDVDVLFLLRQLRKRQDLRTILLTSDVEGGTLTEAVALGAAGALNLRTPTDVLVKCVRGVFAGEYWFPRDVTRTLLDAIPDTGEKPEPGANADARLTPRETDVMQAVARGKTNREIAEELKMSEHTVKQHLKRVFGKLEVSSRVELVLRVAGRGR